MSDTIKIAFVDEMRKIASDFGERPTRVIKIHSEDKWQKIMAKLRAKGLKGSGEGIKTLFDRYRQAAPHRERIIRKGIK